MIALISSDKEQLYLLQMARLIDGLAMFDAILIVPMLQIVWTFFSIFTGFIYFEEFRVCTMSLTVIDVDEMFMICPQTTRVSPSFRICASAAADAFRT